MVVIKETNLSKKACQIRKDIIDVCVNNKAGHIAPSLSSVDILTALYYGCMSYDFSNPTWEGRDRLIFSKAHGCYALYAILADKGVIPKSEWNGFYTQDSTLTGCNERRVEYGLEAGCGSLGHGLPMAVGIAYGAKIQKKGYDTYCVVGDGEMQEGSTWEAIQFAVKHELSNLIIIVDKNRLQAMDFLADVLDVGENDIIKRLKGFGLSPRLVAGHDVNALVKVLNKAKHRKGNKPTVIVAKTVKGFSLKCMENVPKFHFRIPTPDELGM